MKRGWPLFAFILFTGLLHAQVTVSADKKTIAPGEPITLSIKIASKQETQPLIGDTLGIFEVLKKLPLQSGKTENGFTISQFIIITSFDSGKYLLPAIGATDTSITKSKVDTILVQPMPADSLKGYGDIRSYFSVEPPSQWMIRLALLLAVILSGALLYWLYRRNKKNGPLPDEARITTPQEWRRQWKDLKEGWQQGKLTHEQAAEFHMILVRSLFAMKGMATESRTGGELLQLAQKTWLPEQLKQLKSVISHCYTIQFAKQQPAATAIAEQIELLAAIGHHFLSDENTNTNQ